MGGWCRWGRCRRLRRGMCGGWWSVDFGRGAVADRLSQFRALGRWLEAEGLSVGELDRQRAERFVVARRAAGYRTWVASSGVSLPLAFLIDLGVAPAPNAPVVAGAVDALIEDYRRYLLRERRLAATTVSGYERLARLFLEDRERHDGELRLDRLSAADASAFVAAECQRRTVAGARGMVAKLRPLLVYLHVAGLIAVPLRWAVPKVADIQGLAIPRALEPDTVARLLASCDRQREVGRRDYAILLLLVRLGLRAGEVAAMRLEDIDWRAGEILVRGKGGRHDRLPLPADVGEAIADYLQHRRPSDSRAVFVKMLAPGGALGRTVAGDVTRRACRRAGLPVVGSHRLRHTAATLMLRAGCSLAKIGQVLRHEQLRTTAIYAKVDYAALRILALPWPEGGAA
jgi:integrase/recombinase XerD